MHVFFFFFCGLLVSRRIGVLLCHDNLYFRSDIALHSLRLRATQAGWLAEHS